MTAYAQTIGLDPKIVVPSYMARVQESRNGQQRGPSRPTLGVVPDAEPPLGFTVYEASVGARVDALLAELSGVSRAQVKRWIDAGRVTVGDEVVRPSRKLALGETIEARPLEPVEMALAPEAIPLEVLYEDEHLIVIDTRRARRPPGAGAPGRNPRERALAHCGDL